MTTDEERAVGEVIALVLGLGALAIARFGEGWWSYPAAIVVLAGALTGAEVTGRARQKMGKR